MEPAMQILWTPNGFTLQQSSMLQQSLLDSDLPVSGLGSSDAASSLSADITAAPENPAEKTPENAGALLLDHFDVKSPLFWKVLQERPEDALYALGYQKHLSADSYLRYLWSIARAFIQNLAMNNTLEVMREHTKVQLEDEDRTRLLRMAPFGNGRQWITPDWLESIWSMLQKGFYNDAKDWDKPMSELLKKHQPDLEPAQRVYFHLIENPQAEEGMEPFAFLATYAIKTPEGRLRHVPLSHVFQEFDKSDPRLLSMLSALSKAANISPMLDEFLITGEIFHPLQMSSYEAWELLKAIPELEKIGICSRIPNWWKKKSASAGIAVTMGGKKPSLLGMDTIINMRPSLIINGRKLTKAEIKELLAMDEGLHLIKGSWVEVDHAKLKKLLETMEKYEGDITLSEALHLSAGLQEQDNLEDDLEVEVMQAAWLQKMMDQLRSPDQIRMKALPKSVHATLRPYQHDGIKWLNQLGTLGFGACLADDMGLGKTLQLLAYLESWRQKNPDGKVLLAAPASLLGNWEKELQKFVPDMPYQVVHPSRKGSLHLDETNLPFFTITTYGMLSRLPFFSEHEWDCFVLDEAQAIKNVNTRQTKTVKSIPAKNRIALTGTPVENDLSNLWSLFDFLNKGLLGTRKEFGTFTKTLEDKPENYSRLKQMISPFLLRRLKTDPAIAPDLPQKLEKTDYIQLTDKQIALYHQVTNELEARLGEQADEEFLEEQAGTPGKSKIQRKGMIFSALMHLKQICNHPDQYTGQTTYSPKDSGKFEYLKEICQNIKEQHECVLVFTQFKEIIPQLDACLYEVFQAPGLTIDGSTPPAKRTELTERFNAQKEYIPYMVLSLKAAGTGLNLTAASHVIHFDRWWNPAVENQATDRAYRIGQHKNVVVHKFVSTGTIEEKIDEMIESKKELADKVVETSEAGWITQLSNADLIDLLRGGF